MTTLNKENLLAAFGDDCDLLLTERCALIGMDEKSDYSDIKPVIAEFFESATAEDVKYLFDMDGHQLFPDLEDILCGLVGDDAAYEWIEENEK